MLKESHSILQGKTHWNLAKWKYVKRQHNYAAYLPKQRVNDALTRLKAHYVSKLHPGTVNEIIQRPKQLGNLWISSFTCAARDFIVVAPRAVGLAHGAGHLFGGQPETIVTEICGSRSWGIISGQHSSIHGGHGSAAGHSCEKRHADEIQTRNMTRHSRHARFLAFISWCRLEKDVLRFKYRSSTLCCFNAVSVAERRLSVFWETWQAERASKRDKRCSMQ